MLADLRDALRQLRNAPGFALTAIITLALGIGATTAIFTLVHQVMLKSLRQATYRCTRGKAENAQRFPRQFAGAFFMSGPLDNSGSRSG